MYKHILIPTDGSALSLKAAREAGKLAGAGKAKVTALYVVAPYMPPVMGDGYIPAPDGEMARRPELEEFGANLKGNVKAGLQVTPTDFAEAEQARAVLFQKFRALFERYDLLLMPASPVKQFPVEQNFPTEVNGKKLENYTDWIAGSFLITLMSLPGGSVPAGLTAERLPVGMQIVGARFEEPKILSLAKLIQQMHPIGWPPVV